MKPFELPITTKIGSVHLQVSNMEASLRFYSQLLGFRIIEIKESFVFLSSNGSYPSQITLSIIDNSTDKPYKTTGLYHLGIRLPSRKELAITLKRLLEFRWQLCGLSDHTVSEAIYLSDPDDNGIELYVDRTDDVWNSTVDMTTTCMNPRGLLEEIEDKNEYTWQGIHPEADIGHIHLQVSDLNKAAAFYHNLLGFKITWRESQGALFLAAGSYHHHIALNTWSSKNASSPPSNSVGLLSYSFFLDTEKSLNKLINHLKISNYAYDLFSTNNEEGLSLDDPDGIMINFIVNK
ncbi:VOC family protein [Alkaliphilus peptidifermentans]|uniref:Catechol 2,3-dioxygenase n=1 Tax=Alkaliphilus peptidifermentans DSM 18978 TaxID=1120976 RepID=A0A1G5JYL2_9FIRM|nr:VOC family protein [Alkaliphilus peptidifermentans]SCY93406.1 catechol 2,3-dioxygenase [Alkaliphilus peptidifermentans DSM 18978]